MAAGTTNARTCNAAALYRTLHRVSIGRQTSKALRPVGPFILSIPVSIALTNIDDANDEVFAITFPDQTYLLDLEVQATDMDTHATPTLVFDVITETSGGTEVVLINDSTIGQAGGYDEIDATTRRIGRDVSNLKLGIKVVTAAATGATGTITFRCVIMNEIITDF